MLLPRSLQGTLTPRNAYWTTQSPAEVEAAAAWVNARTSHGDLVISPSNIAWLLAAKTADLQMATTWEGLPTWPMKRPLSHDQFHYAADLAQARFVVLGDIDFRWAIHQPNVDKLLQRLETEKWPVVWQGDHYVILQNPRNQPVQGSDDSVR